MSIDYLAKKRRELSSIAPPELFKLVAPLPTQSVRLVVVADNMSNAAQFANLLALPATKLVQATGRIPLPLGEVAAHVPFGSRTLTFPVRLIHTFPTPSQPSVVVKLANGEKHDLYAQRGTVVSERLQTEYPVLHNAYTSLHLPFAVVSTILAEANAISIATSDQSRAVLSATVTFSWAFGDHNIEMITLVRSAFFFVFGASFFLFFFVLFCSPSHPVCVFFFCAFPCFSAVPQIPSSMAATPWWIRFPSLDTQVSASAASPASAASTSKPFHGIFFALGDDLNPPPIRATVQAMGLLDRLESVILEQHAMPFLVAGHATLAFFRNMQQPDQQPHPQPQPQPQQTRTQLFRVLKADQDKTIMQLSMDAQVAPRLNRYEYRFALMKRLVERSVFFWCFFFL